MPQNKGASKDVWEHFAQALSLQGDLLPVVSDTDAKISAQSTMSALGKTPSCFNGRGEAVGIAGWTQKVATAEEVERWSADNRLGICLQTRRVRAFDIDISEVGVAQAVSDFLTMEVGFMPCRVRANSPKRLFIFELKGDLPKRVCKTQGGMVEMLGSGQQFVAEGTHTSGVRYEWQGGLPTNIPELTLAELDSVWAKLCEKFGVGPAIEASGATISRSKKLHQAIEADPVAQFILNNWEVKGIERDGRLHIKCAFEHDHSDGPGAISSTSYFPQNTGGYSQGHVMCLHSHCEGRTDEEFLQAMGYSDPDALTFEDLTKQDSASVEVAASETVLDKPKKDTPANPFNFVHVSELSRGLGTRWAIRDWLPQADLGVVYGASGAGKSFVLLSMAAAISRDGFDWCGKRTTRGKVAFIVAEGSKNFWGRVCAYSLANGIRVDELDMLAVTNSPDLMQEKDAALIASALAGKGVTMLIIDTLAQSFSGDDNSSKDISMVVRNCQKIGRHLNAMCILVHHVGKDTSRGARGSTALKAAADVEIEVAKDDEGRRSVRVTKQKDGSDDLPPIYFSLDSVIVGFDEHGAPIDSSAIDFGGA